MHPCNIEYTKPNHHNSENSNPISIPRTGNTDWAGFMFALLERGRPAPMHSGREDRWTGSLVNKGQSRSAGWHCRLQITRVSLLGRPPSAAGGFILTRPELQQLSRRSRPGSSCRATGYHIYDPPTVCRLAADRSNAPAHNRCWCYCTLPDLQQAFYKEMSPLFDSDYSPAARVPICVRPDRNADFTTRSGRDVRRATRPDSSRAASCRLANYLLRARLGELPGPVSALAVTIMADRRGRSPSQEIVPGQGLPGRGLWRNMWWKAWYWLKRGRFASDASNYDIGCRLALRSGAMGSMPRKWPIWEWHKPLSDNIMSASNAAQSTCLLSNKVIKPHLAHQSCWASQFMLRVFLGILWI